MPRRTRFIVTGQTYRLTLKQPGEDGESLSLGASHPKLPRHSLQTHLNLVPSALAEQAIYHLGLLNCSLPMKLDAEVSEWGILFPGILFDKKFQLKVPSNSRGYGAIYRCLPQLGTLKRVLGKIVSDIFSKSSRMVKIMWKGGKYPQLKGKLAMGKIREFS